MKVISFILLIYYINSIYGLLDSPEEEELIIEWGEWAYPQDFENSYARAIETNFDMLYSSKVHCEHSNSPVAPRYYDLGYYIAFTDKNKYLHILSYDKYDKLIKDFNTKEKAYPIDITTNIRDDDGFYIYMVEADNSYHSYLSLYNKEFQLVKKVQIMNNSEKDDKTVDSNIEKQIIRYEVDGKPAYGMRFMYNPKSGKLAYIDINKRICLIFSHSNYFIDKGEDSADSIVCFNKTFDDMEFGLTWGASHSLIQSVAINNLHFWTASLSDRYPMGIKITYTSLHHFSKTNDPINKKNNLREYVENDDIVGIIKGYMNGTADGRLGGLLYFEYRKIYCLVYAKTPDVSGDSNNGTNIIYMTTWRFEHNLITNIKTIVVKKFISGKNVMQVRAGKFGYDYVFILYANTTIEGGNGYGNVPKGTIPYFTIIDVLTLKRIKADAKLNRFLMPTNEDLKTFQDGVIIWATSNKEGKLTINKVGYVGGIE